VLQIHIGFRSYYYKCLDYFFLNQDLIVGLAVGLGVVALVALSVALYFIIRKLRSRKKPPASDGHTSLTAFQQIPDQITEDQNIEMTRPTPILPDNEANDYSSRISNGSYLQNQNGSEPRTNRSNDTAYRPTRNDKCKTIYPPPISKSHDCNEYLSNINDDRAECGAPDNRPGFTNGVGGLESHSKQSHFPQSSGSSLENYDYNLSQFCDESEDNKTYANYDELIIIQQMNMNSEI